VLENIPYPPVPSVPAGAASVRDVLSEIEETPPMANFGYTCSTRVSPAASSVEKSVPEPVTMVLPDVTVIVPVRTRYHVADEPQLPLLREPYVLVSAIAGRARTSALMIMHVRIR